MSITRQRFGTFAGPAAEGVTAANVRMPHARWIVAGGSLIVCAVLLVFARDYTFFHDEWTFIVTSPGWNLGTIFRPHNEHPSMLLRLVYLALLDTVGLRSYVPYMVVLLLFHLADVVLLFEVIRRRAGDLIAVAAAGVLLVLGAGAEDYLWAFQLAWLASVAFGLAALLVLQGRSTPLRGGGAAGLLAVSLMFSGIGLPFAIAAAVILLASPGRRRDLVWFLPVALALVLWSVTFGRLGNHPDPQPSAFNLVLDPLYTLWGLGASAAGLIGASADFGAVALIVAGLVLILAWRRRRPDPWTLGVAFALVAFYAIAGLTRAQLGYQQAAASRYVYVAAVFWLILLADAARGIPWRGSWRVALVALVSLVCLGNIAALAQNMAGRQTLMQQAAADFQALDAERHDPCLNPDAEVDSIVMTRVTPPLYYSAVDRYGDPAAALPIAPPAGHDTAIRNLRQPHC
jgi:hypothetical protein